MPIQYTKNLNLGKFELGTTLSWLSMTCLFSSPISDSKVNSEDHPFSLTDVTVAEFLLEDYLYKKF